MGYWAQTTGLLQGSKIALVRSYLRVPKAAGQVKILNFLGKIKFYPYMPIIFVMQGKCLFSDISRPVLGPAQFLEFTYLTSSTGLDIPENFCFLKAIAFCLSVDSLVKHAGNNESCVPWQSNIKVHHSP